MSNREPLAIRGALVALVAAVLNLIVAFGVNLNAEQVGVVSAAVAALTLGFIIAERLFQ